MLITCRMTAQAPRIAARMMNFRSFGGMAFDAATAVGIISTGMTGRTVAWTCPFMIEGKSRRRVSKYPG